MFLKKVLPKANHCIRLFLFSLFFAFGKPAFSQGDITGEIRQAYKHFLNFQLDSCAGQLKSIQENPNAFYLTVLLNSTHLFVNEDEEMYKKAKKEESDFINKIGHADFSEAYKNFLKSEIKLQHGLLKLKYGDEISGFWNLKQAYSFSKQNISDHPEFLPSYKTLGICHILFGVLPRKYNWILSLFGIEGNISVGLSELEKVSASQDFYALESGITEALVYAYLLNSPAKGTDLLSKIDKKHHHLIIDYAFALVLMKNSESDEALKTIQTAEYTFPQPFSIPQLYYLKGEIFLQKGRYDSAVINYQRFITLFNGQNLVKDAYYKIGICYFLKDNLQEMLRYFELSKQKGQAKNETDKNAQIAVDKEIMPAKELFILRYATDGGYYDRAEQIRKQADTAKFNLHDKCEYFYRSGRLFQKSGDSKKAKEAYLKTIEFQQNESWYFAPNAALKLGLMLIEEEEYDEALRYLELIEKYNNYPYQKSISQQAAAASKNTR